MLGVLVVLLRVDLSGVLGDLVLLLRLRQMLRSKRLLGYRLCELLYRGRLYLH
jgi:hypothetical protein